MSRVDELLRELCVDGVVFRKVDDIAEVGTGSSDRKDAVRGGDYPFYVRSQSALQADHFEFDEDAIVIPGEGGIGEIFHFVSGKYALHQRAYRIKILIRELDPKFAFYYLSVHFKKFILLRAVSSTVTSIRKPMITEFRIPVPPLQVQREIVRILDRFTDVESELEEKLRNELKARQLQYGYLRDRLLGGVIPESTWLAMGEVGKFARGRRFTRADVVEGGIPSIHYGEIYTHYGVAASSSVRQVREDLRPQLRFALPGDVVIASVGETVEDVGKAVAWLGDEPVAIHDDTFGFKSSMNPKFVSYWMQTEAFHSQKTRHVASAKIKRLSSSALASIVMPVPAMDEQERIVKILDKFDALVNDLSIGLPAELAARRKQYEYYRDKLLTFEEAPA